jgi:microcompartment protein CcmL/EutN
MEALALLELDSIAAGYRTMDAVVKAARIDLIEGRPIDPGKFAILFGGDVASVEASFLRGKETAGESIVDTVFLPAAHESLFPLLAGDGKEGRIDSLGIIETGAVASVIRAADAAAKAAPVRLIRIHRARRIGGKGYVILTGTLPDVEAAVDAGAARAEAEGHLLSRVVIPAPADEVLAKVREEWLS